MREIRISMRRAAPHLLSGIQSLPRKATWPRRTCHPPTSRAAGDHWCLRQDGPDGPSQGHVLPLLWCAWRPLAMCGAALSLTRQDGGAVPKPKDSAPLGLTLRLTLEVCCKRRENQPFSKTGFMGRLGGLVS